MLACAQVSAAAELLKNLASLCCGDLHVPLLHRSKRRELTAHISLCGNPSMTPPRCHQLRPGALPRKTGTTDRTSAAVPSPSLLPFALILRAERHKNARYPPRPVALQPIFSKSKFLSRWLLALPPLSQTAPRAYLAFPRLCTVVHGTPKCPLLWVRALPLTIRDRLRLTMSMCLPEAAGREPSARGGN